MIKSATGLPSGCLLVGLFFLVTGERLVRASQTMLLGGLLLFVCGGLAAYHSWAHDVGEPGLQELPIWSQCCGDGDCVPQRLHILSNETGEKLSVEIEGIQTAVDKQKFSPVPSDRSWVCYARPGGAISNDNIRSILYPQQGGTT